MLELENVRPLNKDILLRRVENIRQSSIIDVIDKREGDLNSYTVISVGEKCTDVKAGDVVLVPFAEHTPPFLIDGELYAITDESKVAGIIE